MSSTVETASGVRPYHLDLPDEALEDRCRRRRRLATRRAVRAIEGRVGGIAENYKKERAKCLS